MSARPATQYLFGVALAAVLGLGATSAHTFADEIVLNGETGSPASSVQASISAIEFGKRLEEQSSGQIKFNLTFGGARAGLGEIADAVGSGVLQVGTIGQNYTPGLFPLLTALSVADFRLTTGGDLVAVNAILAQLFEEFPEFEAEAARQNIKIIGFMPMDEFALISNEPIATLADMKGKKIRASVDGALRALNNAGATAVSMPWAETHTSLQTGLLDGVWTNAGWLLATKTHEISKNLTYVDNRAAIPTMVLGMNLDTWNSLSDEQKAIVDNVHKEMLVETGTMIAAERKMALDAFQSDPSMKYIVMPEAERNAWLEATPDFLAEVAKDLEAKGLPGEKITGRMKELYKAYNDGSWDPKKAIDAAAL
ncbi:MAG: TRAP transporter substrate-binding protein [Rhizobiaceae bacterium]